MYASSCFPPRPMPWKLMPPPVSRVLLSKALTVATTTYCAPVSCPSFAPVDFLTRPELARSCSSRTAPSLWRSTSLNFSVPASSLASMPARSLPTSEDHQPAEVSLRNSATARTGLAANAEETNSVSEAIANRALRIFFSCGLNGAITLPQFGRGCVIRLTESAASHGDIRQQAHRQQRKRDADAERPRRVPDVNVVIARRKEKAEEGAVDAERRDALSVRADMPAGPERDTAGDDRMPRRRHAHLVGVTVCRSDDDGRVRTAVGRDEIAAHRFVGDRQIFEHRNVRPVGSRGETRHEALHVPLHLDVTRGVETRQEGVILENAAVRAVVNLRKAPLIELASRPGHEVADVEVVE